MILTIIVYFLTIAFFNFVGDDEQSVKDMVLYAVLLYSTHISIKLDKLEKNFNNE
nr:MAG: hypothetical protein [Caudoviricetes sp.]